MDAVWLTLRMLLALACVLGLIWFGARRWGRQRGTRRDEPQVSVVARTALGRHTGVAVVAVGNRRLLVGFGDTEVNLLTELAPVVVAPAVVTPRTSGDGGHGRAAASADRTTPADAPAARTSGVAGSVLSPQTWKDTLHLLQEKTVRR